MTESTFEQVASELRRRAEMTSLGMGLGREEAEDISQEVMLRLWAMHEELEDTGRLERLPVMMAKRLSLNMIRDRKTVTLPDDAPLRATTSSPAEILEEKEDAEWLEERMAHLPETQSIILRMRQVERRSLNEIAVLLDIKEKSVSTLLARARKSLLADIKRRNGR